MASSVLVNVYDEMTPKPKPEAGLTVKFS